jgi:three-Cys-motif partner protein
MRTEADHEFGSQDTDLKLSLVEAYLKHFTTALRGKFSELWYFDAFAGTGERTVRVAARDGDLFDEPAAESVDRRRGSAKIAIDVKPPFDHIVFVEKRPKSLAALRALGTGPFPSRLVPFEFEGGPFWNRVGFV